MKYKNGLMYLMKEMITDNKNNRISRNVMEFEARHSTKENIHLSEKWNIPEWTLIKGILKIYIKVFRLCKK